MLLPGMTKWSVFLPDPLSLGCWLGWRGVFLSYMIAVHEVTIDLVLIWRHAGNVCFDVNTMVIE